MKLKRGHFLLPRLLAAVFGALACALLSAAEPAVKSFDVPAGKAEQTLPVLAQQAGIELVYSIDKVEGVATSRVKGELTVRAALDQMLAGSGLVAVEDAKTGAFAVRAEVSAKKEVQPDRSTDVASPASSEVAEKVVKLEGYVVHGYRESLQVSLDAKRKADSIVDVISAEDVSKFPDTNVADSLSHIPGVTVDHLFGQAERVSILGTDPNLNRTLLNGQDVSSGDWYVLDQPSRQFNYTLLAPEVIGQATVYKTPEARIVEGSIGGTIDLSTRDPLSLPAFTTSGSVGLLYNDRSGKKDPNLSEVASWHNETGTIGVLLGLQSFHEFIRRDGVETAGNFPSTSLSENVPIGTILPYFLNTALFQQERKRTGGNLSLVFKPTDKLKLTLTGLDVKVDDTNSNNSFGPVTGNYWSGSALGNPVIVNGVLDSALEGPQTPGGNTEFFNDIFYRAAVIKTSAYDAKAEYKVSDDLFVTAQGGYTHSNSGTKAQYYAEFLNGNSSGGGADGWQPYWNGISPGGAYGWYTPNPIRPGLPFEPYPYPLNVNITGYTNTPTYTYGPGSAGFGTTPSLIQNGGVGGFNGNVASDPETDSEKYLQLDAQWKVKAGPINKIFAGLRYTDHTTGQNEYNLGLPSWQFTSLADFSPGLTPGNFLTGMPSTKDMSSHSLGNPTAIANYVGNLPYLQSGQYLSYAWYESAPGTGGGSQVLGSNGTPTGQTASQLMTMNQALAAGDGFQPQSSFLVNEVVNAGYVEAAFDLGSNASGNFGVRYVQTKTSASGYQSLDNGITYSPVTITHQYDDFLPALNLLFNVAQDSDIRFAVSQVIARPNFPQEAPYVDIYDNNRKNGVFGNPNLDPYKATDVDAAYEWYFAKNSYLAVNLFYKSIANYILSKTVPLTEFDTLTGAPATYMLTGPVNAGKATSKGGAISVQKLWNGGFGLSGNYTYVDAVADTGDQLPYSSKQQINISPFFENKQFLARVTYGWRSQYLTSSFNGTSNVYTKPYTELDANFAYNLTKNISLTFAITNLLDETYYQYYKTSTGGQFLADEYKEGRRFLAGIHWNY
ncbi:MAG: TonB-dependent receptor [Opitutales bacterium]